MSAWFRWTAFALIAFSYQIVQVAKALGEVHKCGVIHGDVRSDNVLIRLDSDADVVFIDFARSKLVEPGSTDALQHSTLNDVALFGWLIAEARIDWPEPPPDQKQRYLGRWTMRDCHGLFVQEKDDWVAVHDVSQVAASLSCGC